MIRFLNWLLRGLWDLFRYSPKRKEPQAVQAESIAAGHELSDWNIRAIARLAIGIVTLAAMIHLGIGGVLFWWRSLIPASYHAASALPQAKAVPPQPRLQINTRLELESIRKRHSDQIESYGWIDRGSGIAHVPIEEAFRLLLRGEHPASRRKESGS